MTGIPVSKLMEGEVEKLIHMEERLHDPRDRPGDRRGGRVQCTAPFASWAAGSQPADRDLPLHRPHWRGQDRAGPGAGRVHVRLRGRDGAYRHVGVHGEALGVAPRGRAARLRGVRGGRPADRSGPPPALLGAPARRDRKGARRRVQRAAAGDGRRPPDRRPGPHGRLQEHRRAQTPTCPAARGRGGDLQADSSSRLDDIVEFHQRARGDRRDRGPRGQADRTCGRAAVETSCRRRRTLLGNLSTTPPTGAPAQARDPSAWWTSCAELLEGGSLPATWWRWTRRRAS